MRRDEIHRRFRLSSLTALSLLMVACGGSGAPSGSGGGSDDTVPAPTGTSDTTNTPTTLSIGPRLGTGTVTVDGHTYQFSTGAEGTAEALDALVQNPRCSPDFEGQFEINALAVDASGDMREPWATLRIGLDVEGNENATLGLIVEDGVRYSIDLEDRGSWTVTADGFISSRATGTLNVEYTPLDPATGRPDARQPRAKTIAEIDLTCQ